jgi:hypothetical protein
LTDPLQLECILQGHWIAAAASRHENHVLDALNLLSQRLAAQIVLLYRRKQQFQGPLNKLLKKKEKAWLLVGS